MALTAAQVADELARIQRLHQQDHDDEARTAIEALVKALPHDLDDDSRFAVLWQWADLRSHADEHVAAVEAYLACAPLLERLGKLTRAGGLRQQPRLPPRHARATRGGPRRATRGA